MSNRIVLWCLIIQVLVVATISATSGGLPNAWDVFVREDPSLVEEVSELERQILQLMTVEQAWAYLDGAPASQIVLFSGETLDEFLETKGLAVFDVPWFSVDGGGLLISTGGDFEFGGVVGQPDAGEMSGGVFAVSGGFWSAGGGTPDGCEDCDDGLYCNGVETCDIDSGVCQAGVPIDCDDGVSCTVDACNESTDSCDNLADNGLCDNGLFCDGLETCDLVSDCQPASAVDCDDGVSCTIDACNEGTDSCDNTADDLACDNGAFCDGMETCDASLGCQAGTAVDCDDGVSCTIDACDESSDSCDNAPDDGLCDNGLFCDGAETCNPTDGCQMGIPPSCDDGNACTIDACNEETDTCDYTSDDQCDPPFVCNGEALIIQNQNAQLTMIEQSVSPFVFIDIGGPAGIEINALGFRGRERMLYGVELSSSGNVQIVRIDATGTVHGLGRPSGLPSNIRFDAGDVSPDGSTMYVTAVNRDLYHLDLTALPIWPAATSVSVSGSGGFVFDWAVSPLDGMLYGGDSTHGQLAILDPATGVRADVNLAGLPSGAGYGGAWFDEDGHLFLYQNDGNLYEIDTMGPAIVSTQTGPGATRNDGTACIDLTPPPVAVDLVKSGTPDLGANGDVDVGDTIDYTFEVTNTGTETLTNVTVSDPLVPSISCPGGYPISALTSGVTVSCTGTYAITQSDIDAGERDNTATVTGDHATGQVSDQDSATVSIRGSTFNCDDGDAFIVQGQNAQLNRVDQSVSPFVFDPVGPPTGIEINNLGYRSTDGLLYGLELSATGNVGVIQIDATGAVTSLGRPSGLPANKRFDAGDVSPDGTTMYFTATNQPLYRLDLTQVPTLPAVTSVNVTGATGHVFDWAVSPIDGRLYGGDSSNGQLASIDPLTGVRTDVNLAGLPSGAGYGGAWFDADGTLFLYQNDGFLYEIDVTGPTVVSTQSGPTATRNDGAACMATPAAAVRLTKTGTLDLGGDGEATVDDVINYTFEVTNTGDSETLTDVTITDPLVPVIICPGGHPIASLASGATVTCNGMYAITQADINAGVRNNTADVTGLDSTLTSVSDQDDHSEPIPQPWTPFTACPGDPLIIQNEDAVLTRVDQSMNPFVFVSLGGPTGTEINNLGYRSTDDLLYGVELSSGGNVQILQIDSNGNTRGLGRPAGLPTGPRFDAGDVSPDGSTMYITATNQRLYRLDLTQVPLLPAVTSVAVSGANGHVFDWAVSPIDGMLYGGDSSGGQLARIDPATGQRTDVNVVGLPNGAGYGGAWFESTGRLFLYRNSGAIYEIDVAGAIVVDVQTGPGASRNDGAACIPMP